MPSINASNFEEAQDELHSYPSRGARSANGGVPSRPSLGRYMVIECTGQDPGQGDPLRSENRLTLAGLLSMVENQGDRPLEEIVQEFESKDDLRDAADAAVRQRYSVSEETDLTGHLNHTAATIAAVGFITHGFDPVEVVDSHLDGETISLAEARSDSEE